MSKSSGVSRSFWYEHWTSGVTEDMVIQKLSLTVLRIFVRIRIIERALRATLVDSEN